jgi:hypothetical protein
MEERRPFWDAEGRRRSRNPYEKSTIPWIDDTAQREFMLFHVLDQVKEDWDRKLLELRLVSKGLIENVRRDKARFRR